MVLADYLFIGGIVLFAILGLGLGLGKQLGFFTRGIFGLIISVFLCYLLFGFVYNILFVQERLAHFREVLGRSNGFFLKILRYIRVDIICYAVALFLIVTVLRIILMLVLKGVLEIDTPVMKVLNKSFGLILGVAVFFALGLIVMQIMYLSGDGNVPQTMKGSVFGLDYVYTHNPLTKISALWR